MTEEKKIITKKKPHVFGVLKPYAKMVYILIIFALISNAVNLVIPQLISHAIDDFSQGIFYYKENSMYFLIAAGIIFIFTYLQTILQTYASEKVARDLRSQLADKISRQNYEFIIQTSPAKLLTNITSDIDSIKLFVSMAVVSIASSLFIIIGASILLISINYKLAVPVLFIIPAIGIGFFIVLRKVRVIFKKSREVIDWLNKVINESVIAAALVRVINSQHVEYNKFLDANTKAKSLGISILKLFAGLMPMVVFVSNIASLIILALGGHFVITGEMSLGDFAAFSSYLVILIFPIIIIGFMSSVMAQASASYERIREVLDAEDIADTGTVNKTLEGTITFSNVTVVYNEKSALKNISFTVEKEQRLAIIGPTAAGKSQILHLLAGLIKPNSGTIAFDNIPLADYNKNCLQQQIGLVFQDSVIFNMSVKENIAFNQSVTEESLTKAIETAELQDFISSLPKGLDTIISERGSSLSGGQKQRIMLARALALNPKILLLDDFTARVDSKTEQNILANIRKNYPQTTLLSVTQKISSITEYHKIILLMEGEILASGTHQELLESSAEYVQIYNSQRSTNHYEL